MIWPGLKRAPPRALELDGDGDALEGGRAALGAAPGFEEGVADLERGVGGGVNVCLSVGGASPTRVAASESAGAPQFGQNFAEGETSL